MWIQKLDAPCPDRISLKLRYQEIKYIGGRGCHQVTRVTPTTTHIQYDPQGWHNYLKMQRISESAYVSQGKIMQENRSFCMFQWVQTTKYKQNEVQNFQLYQLGLC